MTLTKGQKDALVRKAMAIVEAKKEAKREELRKGYKLSKEATEFLVRVKKFFKAREEYIKAVNSLGFAFGYCNVETNRDEPFYMSVNHSDKNASYEKVENDVVEKELSKYNAVFKYPTQEEVYDEIELMNLSKSSFDVDAFLSKYQNL